jgi:LPXTG-motif cell wall-anchored protein
MKKLRLAVAVAVVASFAVLASSPAQAYPVVQVHVSERTVTGGNSILIEASVIPTNIDCSWELVFLGQHRFGSGNSISETFSTPTVQGIEHHTATATCEYNSGPQTLGGGSASSLGTSLHTADPASASGSGEQTLLPRHHGDDNGDGDNDGDGDGDGNGGDNGGLLPNTGGERLAWLIIGGMLVLVGGGVVVASRRRDA